MSEFRRTLETAASAEQTAALLRRVAKAVTHFGDRSAIERLAERYTDYAAALRAIVPAEPDPTPSDDQPALL